MNGKLDPQAKGNGDYLLLIEYNDWIRRPARSLSAERRLLCAVLEDAIRTYLANIAPSSRKQRDAFHEVSRWFLRSAPGGQSLFAFQTICDLREINSEEIRAGLPSLRRQDLSFRRSTTSFRALKFFNQSLGGALTKIGDAFRFDPDWRDHADRFVRSYGHDCAVYQGCDICQL